MIKFKNIILTLVTVFMVVASVHGQHQANDYYITFENHPPMTPSDHHISIDTTSNADNIWQIGKPQKSVFTSAVTIPNVIVTDTINTYPINDTSRFIISYKVNQGTIAGYEGSLNLDYYVDSDTLNDYGIIEYSQDTGATWTNLLDNFGAFSVLINGVYIDPNKPIKKISGSSNSWNHLEIDLNVWSWGSQAEDSVLLRFSFISDSIQNNRDGLMFDNIWIADYWSSGVDENGLNITSAYPNPTSGELNINLENSYGQIDIKVLDMAGKQVISEAITNQSELKLDLNNLTQGIYFVKVSADGKSSVIKVVKN